MPILNFLDFLRTLRASIFFFELRDAKNKSANFSVYLRSLTLVQLSVGYWLYLVVLCSMLYNCYQEILFLLLFQEIFAEVCKWWLGSFSFSPTSHKHQFYGLRSGFSRFIMKIKYVCHGFFMTIGQCEQSYTNLQVGVGGKEKEPVVFLRLIKRIKNLTCCLIGVSRIRIV